MMGIVMPETRWAYKQHIKNNKWHLVGFLFFSTWYITNYVDGNDLQKEIGEALQLATLNHVYKETEISKHHRKYKEMQWIKIRSWTFLFIIFRN